MENLIRRLKMKLPSRQSTFLWGPRKTGKTTLLRQNFPNSVSFNFLNTDLFFDVSKNPSVLRHRILGLKPAQLGRPILLMKFRRYSRQSWMKFII